MTILWIILGLVAYVAIGGILAGIVTALTEDDELDGPFVFIWPIVVFIILFGFIFYGMKAVVEYLTDLFQEDTE